MNFCSCEHISINGIDVLVNSNCDGNKLLFDDFFVSSGMVFFSDPNTTISVWRPGSARTRWGEDSASRDPLAEYWWWPP